MRRTKTDGPQLATCEALVLHLSMQLGEFGPVQLTVAAGAIAKQFSEVTTVAGSTAGDTADEFCVVRYASWRGAIWSRWV
jgi:hypothetical protein